MPMTDGITPDNVEEAPGDVRRARRVWLGLAVVSVGVFVLFVLRRRTRSQPLRGAQPSADRSVAIVETMAWVGDALAAFQDEIADEGDLNSARPRDFVYLGTWDGAMSAVDDPDVREVALGAPDTSARGSRNCSRCLRNLDREVLSAAIPESWLWVQRYRIWEANRRVYVPPENWLEPD